MPSFYVPELEKSKKEIELTGEEFHHAIKVRRLKVNDAITITNGNGLLGSGKICAISKRECKVEIEFIKEEIQSQPTIAAAFSLLKNKHDHMIVEKLTELGIKEFYPIITERSVRQPAGNYTEKFNKVARAAIKQCDNVYLPHINTAKKLPDLIDYLHQKDYEILVALETGNRKQLYNELTQCNNKNVCFVIGPEGGFSLDEINYLSEADVRIVSLGNHILRAETAAIAVAAQILNFYIMSNPDYY